MFLQNVDTLLAFSLIMLLLSTLVTVLVQMAVSILGLRGSNLFWGVQKLVGSIAPELSKVEAEELAKKILSHRSLVVTRDKALPYFRKKLGKTRPPVTIEPKVVLLVLDRLLQSGELSGKVQETVKDLFDRDVADASKTAQSLDFLDSLERAGPEQAAALRDIAQQGLGEVKQIAVGIHDWFDSAMQQASERFTMHTRWWTTGVGVVLALGLGVDSVYLLKQLQANPKVATQIALKSDVMLELAGETVDGIEAAVSQAAPTQDKTTPNEEVAEVDLDQEEQPDGCEAAKITAQKAQEAAQEALSEQKELRSKIDKHANRVEELKNELLGLELTIFTHLPDQRFEGSMVTHVFGLVITALLLGLGGPFWYGLIGRLVGFRSLVAPTKKEKA